MKKIFVDCWRAGKLLATYEFGWAIPSDPRNTAPPTRESLIAEAKNNLATEGKSSPPYDDGISFDVRYP